MALAKSRRFAVNSGLLSTMLVGSGVLLLGISASVFLVACARLVGPAQFSVIAVLWTLMYTIGNGLFQPLEQEIARAATHRRAARESVHELVQAAYRPALVLLAVAAALAAATLPFPRLYEAFFGGSLSIVVAFLVGSAGLGAQFLQRGVFAAAGEFRLYGVQQGVEGAVRTVASLVLALAGITDPLVWAGVLVLSPWVAVVAVAGGYRRAMHHDADTGNAPTRLWGRLGWLLVASLAAMGVANLASPTVQLIAGPTQQEAAGQFQSGLTVARIPLLLYVAVQAVLLPRLTRVIAARDRHGFVRQLRLVLAATAVVGLAGVLGVALIGEPVVRLLFGPAYTLAGSDLTLLAASASTMMLGLALQSAVVAFDDHRASALAWSSGVGAFVLVVVAAPIADVFLRAELGLLAAAALVVLALALRILWRLRNFGPGVGVSGPEPSAAA